MTRSVEFTPRQAALIERYREINVDHDWWDYHYDDFMAQMLRAGVQVDDIVFSGFWSQGDGACFDGGVSESRQLLLWVLVPGYREWFTALAYSSDFPQIEARRWIWRQIESYAETKGFIGQRILEQYRNFEAKLLDVLGDNIKPFIQCDAVGYDLEEMGKKITLTNRNYYHSGTMTMSSFLDDVYFEQYVEDCLDEDDIRYTVLMNLASSAEADLEHFDEIIDNFLFEQADDLYRRLQEDYDYLTSDEAVWEAIEANGLDEEGDDEQVA
jgi:hypothetical protein